MLPSVNYIRLVELLDISEAYFIWQLWFTWLVRRIRLLLLAISWTLFDFMFSFWELMIFGFWFKIAASWALVPTCNFISSSSFLTIKFWKSRWISSQTFRSLAQDYTLIWLAFTNWFSSAFIRFRLGQCYSFNVKNCYWIMFSSSLEVSSCIALLAKLSCWRGSLI